MIQHLLLTSSGLLCQPHRALSNSFWNLVRLFLEQPRDTEIIVPRAAVKVVNMQVSSGLVMQFIKVFLQTGEGSILPVTYEDVFNACKLVTIEANQGEALASLVDQRMKMCAVDIMKELKSLKMEIWGWLDAFIERWNWWQSRLVRV
jgi:hypothetical protein